MAILNKKTFFNQENISYILEKGFHIHSTNPVRFDYENFGEGKVIYYIPKGSTTNEGLSIHMNVLNEFDIQELIIKEDKGNKRTRYWINTSMDTTYKSGRCPFRIRNHSRSQVILTDSTCLTGSIVLENVVIKMFDMMFGIRGDGRVIPNNDFRVFLYDLKSLLYPVHSIQFGQRGGITFTPRIGEQTHILELFIKNEEFHDTIRNQFPNLPQLNLVCGYDKHSYATLIFDLHNPNNSHINICPYLNPPDFIKP